MCVNFDTQLLVFKEWNLSELLVRFCVYQMLYFLPCKERLVQIDVMNEWMNADQLIVQVASTQYSVIFEQCSTC